MAHRVQLIVGRPAVLERYRTIVPSLGIYTLSAGAVLHVIPVNDDALDALHAAHGTGEWLDGVRLHLASGDMAFAAAASRVAPVAYLETDYHGGEGMQGAVAWDAGELVAGPITIDVATQRRRAAPFWPINMALTRIGVVPEPGRDAFDTFGLMQWRSTEAIVAGARRIA